MAKRKAPHGEQTFAILEDACEQLKGRYTHQTSLEPIGRRVNGQDDGYSSDGSEDSIDDPNCVEQSVLEDMTKFEDSFKGITKRFRLIDRIGEGTFSTVYKAEDLLYEKYSNSWDIDAQDAAIWLSPPVKKTKTTGGSAHQKRPRYVAIKKIYVTSSPIRIQNELELLHDLRSCKYICPLITAFRHQDQVVAVLPYYRHQDFREFFREMNTAEMQIYFRSLFRALGAVHKQGIIHRDIKPTNFLYDIHRQRGVLVDFGLAEREGNESTYCVCSESPAKRKQKIERSYVARNPHQVTGYPKQDARPSRRANRAGTRGFRAPEVLFKCQDQTTKIDIWSAGVVLLTILSQRFPFFNSADDVDAMVEITSLFGKKKMRACGLLHGTVFETNVPTIGDRGFSLEKIILWSTCRTKEQRESGEALTAGEKEAIKFLERCLELDPKKRISAKEALDHPFLAEGTDLETTTPEEDEIEVL